MIVFPNAKINLGLNVIKKRPDGFHNIETVFYPVELSDALDVVESKKFQFTITGINPGGSVENNLVVKAYRILENAFRLPSVHIHLHKAIPAGAGLGGGSSDAAQMLHLLNKLFSLNLGQADLEKYASLIGADCPFFIRNTPCFAAGTGNILSPATIDLSEYKIVIIKPPFQIDTSEAYRSIVPRMPESSLKEVIALPVGEWRGRLKNDFEQAIFKAQPEIEEIKESLYNSGAEYALMSGSGSAVFGLFRRLPANLESSFPEAYFIYR